MIIKIYKPNDVVEELDTDNYTAEQLDARGLHFYAEMKRDAADWLAKWDALPSSTKNSPVGLFLKKIANKLGAKL